MVVSTSVPCPHCRKPTRPNLTLCPHCGGSVAGALQERRDPICPRCSAPLAHATDKGVETESCGSCGGLWLDRAGFHRVQRQALDAPAAGPYLKPGRTSPEGPYLPCVRCGKLMNRKNFARVSGVLIDECAHHGVWLDAGELEHVRAFVADGGLERSQDVAIARNAEAIRALAAETQGVRFVQRLLHFWDPRMWFFGGHDR